VLSGVVLSVSTLGIEDCGFEFHTVNNIPIEMLLFMNLFLFFYRKYEITILNQYRYNIIEI
jgi:hypothetical protein